MKREHELNNYHLACPPELEAEFDAIEHLRAYPHEAVAIIEELVQYNDEDMGEILRGLLEELDFER